MSVPVSLTWAATGGCPYACSYTHCVKCIPSPSASICVHPRFRHPPFASLHPCAIALNASHPHLRPSAFIRGSNISPFASLHPLRLCVKCIPSHPHLRPSASIRGSGIPPLHPCAIALNEPPPLRVFASSRGTSRVPPHKQNRPCCVNRGGSVWLECRAYFTLRALGMAPS